MPGAALLLNSLTPRPVTVSPATASLTVTGRAPEIRELSPGRIDGGRQVFAWDWLPRVGWQLRLVRQSWSLSVPPASGTTVVPGTAALTITGQAPTVLASADITGVAAASPPRFAWERLPGGIWALRLIRRGWSYTSTPLASQVVVPDTAQLQIVGNEPVLSLPTQDTTVGGPPLFGWQRVYGGSWQPMLLRRAWSYTQIPVDSGPVTVSPTEAMLLVSSAGAVTLFDTARPAAGVLTLTGQAPSLTFGRVVVPGVRALVLTGFAPKLLEAVLGAVGRISVNGFAPVAGFNLVLGPASRPILISGRVPEIDGVSIWTDVPAPPTIWLDDAPPATPWTDSSRPPTAWSDDAPPATSWTAASGPPTAWTDDSPPATAWTGISPPTTPWTDDAPPATAWSDDAPPATAWTRPASPATPWRELRSERAWETEKLDVTKTEEWDVPTEQMGGGTPRTVWTDVDED